MRSPLYIFIGFALAVGGCAHQRPTDVEAMDAAADNEAEAVTASALVFQAPISEEGLEPVLARDDRQPSAFLGYDDAIAEYFYLRIDDRQSDRHFNNYERRAVSERTGVRYH